MTPSRPLINYYGAKWLSAEWIISNFPEHESFVEAFGGSAAVMMKKTRSEREVINDIDEEIVNLYRQMRDHGPDLQWLCKMTPHSRSEYDLAREHSVVPIERARRTIVKSFFGIGDTLRADHGFRQSKKTNTAAEKTWESWWSVANELTERFRGVSIENLNYIDLINKYDAPGTLFYLDPPYLKALRNRRHKYRHDFDVNDHRAMLEIIQGLSGMAILSGYDHESYKLPGWKRVQKNARTNGAGTNTESLWLCPKTSAMAKQMSLPI